MPTESKEFYTPSGQMETTIHRVNYIGVGRVRTGSDGLDFTYKTLTVRTKDGLEYELRLFADDEEDLTVSFSG